MNKFMESFTREYMPKLGKRASSYMKIFSYLLSTRTPPYQIIETGCARQEDNFSGDGMSTVLFNEFVEKETGDFESVDIDPDAVKFSQNLCPSSNVVCMDSVERIEQLAEEKKDIDLLYLDSMDMNWNNPYPSAVHHLKEFLKAMPMISPGTLLVVDDNSSNIGKGMLVRGIMEMNRIPLYIHEYQWAWIC